MMEEALARKTRRRDVRLAAAVFLLGFGPSCSSSSDSPPASLTLRAFGEADSAAVLASGMEFCEGPVWRPDSGDLILSDIPAKTLMRWSEADGLAQWVKLDGPNGNVLDVDGALLTCVHGARTVVRHGPDGAQPLFGDLDGRRLNSPNDLAVQSDGVLWFTDPPWGLEGQRKGRELPGNWVFRLDRRSGELRSVLHSHSMPNGIALSPAEDRLYVADTGGHPSHPDATFHVGPATVTAYRLEGGELASTEPVWQIETLCDGMCVDSAGRIFATGRDGITVWDPDGGYLGLIPVPERPSNVCLGGRQGQTLFITARTSLYRAALPPR